MPRPRLLDLFCGAGGAAMGYHRAGFDVVGVDIAPQPNYPFEFVQDDALDVLQRHFPFGFDAIHASPPCQLWTAYKRTGQVNIFPPDLIGPARRLLYATRLPFVIENVEFAPLLSPMLLCGSMFDLDIRRHRLFETNWTITPTTWGCRHGIWGPDRYPGGRSVERTGTSRGLVRRTVEVGSRDIPLATQQQAMGIDWMRLEELSQAIPPAYTEFIGRRLIDHLEAKAAA